MALQVWLPLNGSIENKGLLDTSFTGSVEYSDTAKFNKSVSTGELRMPGDKVAQVFNNKEVTITLWLYVNAESRTEESAAGGILFGNNRISTDGNVRHYCIFQYPTCNDLHLSCMNDGTINQHLGVVIANVLPSYQWTHIAFVYKNPEVWAYINGKEAGHWIDIVNTVSNYAYDTPLINSSTTRMVQDLRMYNHALSPREVKEVYQSLYCHTLVGDVDGVVTGKNLFKGSKLINKEDEINFVIGEINWCGTREYTEEGFHIKGNLDGVGNSNGVFFATDRNTIGLKTGDTVTFSADIKGTAGDGEPSICYWATTADSSDFWHKQVFGDSLRDLPADKYTRVSVTIVLDDLYALSEAQWDYFCVAAGFGGEYWIKNIKLEKGSSATPWTPNPSETSSFFSDSDIIYDTSGHCNHGTKVGEFSTSDDTPRYIKSYEFNGKDAYIKLPQSTKIKDEITCAVWGYMDDWSAYAGTKDVRLFSCTEAGGWNIENYYNFLNFPIFANNVYRNCVSETTWASLTPGWHHFAVTYDGKTSCIYLDGNLNKSETHFTSKVPIMYNSNNTLLIGAEAGPGDGYQENSILFNGKMVDFRLYAVALNATEIEEIYNSSLTLTDNNTLISKAEFIEK